MRRLLAGIFVIAAFAPPAFGQGDPPPPPPPGGAPQPQAEPVSRWGADLLLGASLRGWTSSGSQDTLSGTGFSFAAFGGLNLSQGRRLGLYFSYVSGTASDDFDNEFDATNAMLGVGASNGSWLGGKLIFRAVIGLATNAFDFGDFESDDTGLGTMIGIDFKVHRNAGLFLTLENSFFFPDEGDSYQHLAATVGVSLFTAYSQ